MADRVTVNSAAISLTVRGCDASSCRMRRRVGSAAAERASVTWNTLAVTNAFGQMGPLKTGLWKA